MAGVILNGSTSGSVTLDPPAVAGSTVITLPSTSGTMLLTNGDGSGLTGIASPNFSNNYVRLSGASQSKSNNTTVKYTSYTEQADANGWWDAANNKFLPNKAGWYQVETTWELIRAATGELYGQVRLYKNGANLNYLNPTTMHYSASTNNACYMTSTFFVYLNGSTDYVEHYVYHFDYGGSGTCTFNAQHTFINWMGA